MAFGPHFPARETTNEEITGWIRREVNRSWLGRGMGDCAVGILPLSFEPSKCEGRTTPEMESGKGIRIVDRTEFDTLKRGVFESVKWVGYVGVRDANYSIEPRVEGDPALPEWQDMVEIRYGYHPDAWGKGYGSEAAQALMLWAARERGVRRFIAETEKVNEGSGGILRKMGFRMLEGNEYWKESSQWEWEKVVG